MDKITQRKKIKEKLQTLSHTFCETADARIAETVFSLSEYQNASVIFTYVSVGKEVDTRRILAHAWAHGKKVAVPKCLSKGIMDIYEIHSFDDLVPAQYGLLEPNEECVRVDASEIEFGIIPCMSCDRDRNRLGHGGGYYDRYLENTSFCTAALCREMLLLDQVCKEAHDKQVDYVISDKQIY